MLQGSKFTTSIPTFWPSRAGNWLAVIPESVMPVGLLPGRSGPPAVYAKSSGASIPICTCGDEIKRNAFPSSKHTHPSEELLAHNQRLALIFSSQQHTAGSMHVQRFILTGVWILVSSSMLASARSLVYLTCTLPPLNRNARFRDEGMYMNT